MVNPSVRAPRETGKRIVTGVALSPTALCAADLRLSGATDRAWRATIEPATPDGAWPALAAALRELSQSLGGAGGSRVLAVSLLPPLTEVRRLELPPLKDEELHRLLARNAGRYFANARGSQIVGAAPAARASRGAPVPMIAASASARLVSAIRAAAEQAGWQVQSIAPAESAWAAAGPPMWPAFLKQSAWLAVASADRTDLLQLEQGRLAGVRRFRSGGADAAAIAETVGPRASIGVAGEPTVRRQLSESLRDHGSSTALPSGQWLETGANSDLLAAHFAGRESGPVLRSDDAVAVARDRDRRRAWTIAAAAAAVLVLAAAVELWGVHRQLRLVREERARLRPQIASTLVGRTTVDATSRSLTSLTAVEKATPQWSVVIATLSQAITDDAYLTAIRARGDSLIIDGLAEHASRVFDALQRTKLLTDVKSAAPVRREIQDDGTALDHFTISARVVTSDPPPASATAASPAPARAPRVTQ